MTRSITTSSKRSSASTSMCTPRAMILTAYLPRRSKRWVRMFLMKNLAIDRETKRFSWQMNLPVLDAQYDQLNEPLPKDARFEGPTLFIRGGRSNYIRDEDRDLIEHHFPNARVLTIKDAGHWVHADQPAIFGESVVTYLQRED